MKPYYFLIGLAFLPTYIQAQDSGETIYQTDSIVIHTESSVYSLPMSSTLIVDVRAHIEFFEAHFPGAVNLPLNRLIESKELLLKYENVVVVCRTGNRSKIAKNILTKLGLSNVHDGGNWQTLKE